MHKHTMHNNELISDRLPTDAVDTVGSCLYVYFEPLLHHLHVWILLVIGVFVWCCYCS